MAHEIRTSKQAVHIDRANLFTTSAIHNSALRRMHYIRFAFNNDIDIDLDLEHIRLHPCNT